MVWIVSLVFGLQGAVWQTAWQLLAFKVATTQITTVEHSGNGWARCMLMEARRRINNLRQHYIMNELPSNEHCWTAVGWRGIRSRKAQWEFDSTGDPRDCCGQVCPGPRSAGMRSEGKVFHMKEGLTWEKGRKRKRRVTMGRKGKETKSSVKQRCLAGIYLSGRRLIFFTLINTGN